MDTLTVGITGASGHILAKRLLDYLSGLEIELHVVATENGARVFKYETGEEFRDFCKHISNMSARVVWHDNYNLFAPIASGSYGVRAMTVVPCSMPTVGKLACGCADNLLTRAADVCLKERALLALVPRESPMHSVHLRNLLTLSELGAVILPPVPSFYDRAATIAEITDSIVGRLLKTLGVPKELYKKWDGIIDEKN